MMHGHEKSRSAIVAVKPTNKAERSAAESVERRAETKGNVDQQRTRRTQRRITRARYLRGQSGRLCGRCRWQGKQHQQKHGLMTIGGEHHRYTLKLKVSSGREKALRIRNRKILLSENSA